MSARPSVNLLSVKQQPFSSCFYSAEPNQEATGWIPWPYRHSCRQCQTGAGVASLSGQAWKTAASQSSRRSIPGGGSNERSPSGRPTNNCRNFFHGFLNDWHNFPSYNYKNAKFSQHRFWHCPHQDDSKDNPQLICEFQVGFPLLGIRINQDNL